MTENKKNILYLDTLLLRSVTSAVLTQFLIRMINIATYMYLYMFSLSVLTAQHSTVPAISKSESKETIIHLQCSLITIFSNIYAGTHLPSPSTRPEVYVMDDSYKILL